MIKNILKFNEFELQVKDAIIAKKGNQIQRLRKTGENVKAILRIPRLCRQFQERTAAENVPELEILEDVFRSHYGRMEEDLYTSEKYDSVDETKPYISSKEGIEELDAKRRKLALVEQHIVERRRGSPDRLDQKSIASSLDFRRAMQRQGHLRQAHQRLMTQALDLRPRNFDKYGAAAPMSIKLPVPGEFQYLKNKREGPGDGSLNAGFRVAALGRKFKGLEHWAEDCVPMPKTTMNSQFAARHSIDLANLRRA